MTEQRNPRIPAPLYAVAGAGDYAYQQLRKLPTVVNDLSGRAAVSTSELREKAVVTSAELREKAAATLRGANSGAVALRERTAAGELDAERLREAARRNAAVVVAGAHAAQERALAAYLALVARGERVIGSGVVQAADTVNADMEATEAPAQVTATPAGTTGPAKTSGNAKATGPAKSTRPTRSAGTGKRGRGAGDS